VEEVELRASGFEKEEPSGLTDGGEPGPKTKKEAYRAQLCLEPSLLKSPVETGRS